MYVRNFSSPIEYVYQFDAGADIESLKKGIENSDLYAIVEISPMDSTGNVSVSAYAKKQINIDTKEEIEKCVEKGVREKKIAGYDIQNLDSIINDINADVNVRTLIVSEQERRNPVWWKLTWLSRILPASLSICSSLCSAQWL